MKIPQQITQPLLAPLAAGGGIVAGVSAALVGLYQVGDCLAYKTQRGECDAVISSAVPAIVAGVGSVAGAVGGLWTYNPRLLPDVDRRRLMGPEGLEGEPEPTEGPPVREPVLPAPEGLAMGLVEGGISAAVEGYGWQELQRMTVDQMRGIARELGERQLARHGRRAELVSLLLGRPRIG